MIGARFVVLKMTSGETIFAELLENDGEVYTVKSPYSIKSSGDDKIYLTNWMPYNSDDIFDFPCHLVYYIGNLSETYIKFYGSTLLREMITKVQSSGYRRVQDGELESSVLRDIITQIQELGEDYSIKYGLESNSDTESEFSEEDTRSDRVLN